MSDAGRAVAMLLQDNAAIVTECDAGGWAVWMDELVKKARELGVDA